MKKERTPLFPLQKTSHFLIFCLLMLLILFAAFLLAIRLGSVEMDFDVIRRVLVNRFTGRDIYAEDWRESSELIIWTIRTPRILTAFVVGAGLTLCGILMQVLTKNSLADPYVLGISHGASAGAVSVIMYGWLGFLGGYGTMAGAFLGAVISIVLALRIATIRNKVTATQLVLAGIAVSALFGAITMIQSLSLPVSTPTVAATSSPSSSTSSCRVSSIISTKHTAKAMAAYFSFSQEAPLREPIIQ